MPQNGWLIQNYYNQTDNSDGQTGIILTEDLQLFFTEASGQFDELKVEVRSYNYKPYSPNWLWINGDMLANAIEKRVTERSYRRK